MRGDELLQSEVIIIIIIAIVIVTIIVLTVMLILTNTTTNNNTNTNPCSLLGWGPEERWRADSAPVSEIWGSDPKHLKSAARSQK